MTFLEFVCEHLMGPPAFKLGGSSYWRCPYHDDTRPSFYTLRPKANTKDYWKCWPCGGKWGDELDLLKRYHPRENYGDRLDRLRTLRAEYDKLPLSHRGTVEVKPDAVGKALGVLVHAMCTEPNDVRLHLLEGLQVLIDSFAAELAPERSKR